MSFLNKLFFFKLFLFKRKKLKLFFLHIFLKMDTGKRIDLELEEFIDLLFEIPLLNKENYFIQKPLIKDFLIHFNLWNLVNGKEKKPSKSREKYYNYRKKRYIKKHF